MSSSTGFTPPDTKTDGSGNNGGSDRKQGRILGFLGTLQAFLGTLQGLIVVATGLITAIGAGLLGGTQFAGRSQAQPTVFVTVTAGASAASQGTAPSGSAPASSVSTPATVNGTDLSALTPVQNGVDGFTTDSPQPIGTTTFSDAIRFSCSVSNSYYSYNSLIYVVAGYKTLTATFGIPNNATNAAGNSATIKISKDGTELGQPVTVALDHPQRVSLPLQGSSQLEISCVAAKQAGSDDGDDIDVAIGDAILSPS